MDGVLDISNLNVDIKWYFGLFLEMAEVNYQFRLYNIVAEVTYM
jgi:hypothetical protein